MATDLDITGNVIWSNTAVGDAGGMFVGDSVGTVQSNRFVGNSASSWGGGVYLVGTSTDMVLRGNWFEDNSSLCGGGLAIGLGAAPLVDGNTFVTNTAPSGLGGAVYLNDAGSLTVTNNIFAHNGATLAGGGVAVVETAARIVNNTIAGNSQGGVSYYDADGLVVVNNVIVGNTQAGIVREAGDPGTVYTIDHNNVYSNAVDYLGLTHGAHDMWPAVDPQFLGTGPLTVSYHIQQTSPVSVTGSTAWAPERDFDGDLRWTGGSVSMGADEIALPAYHVYLPFALRNSP
jgi:parallel beta-helix repeat protein